MGGNTSTSGKQSRTSVMGFGEYNLNQRKTLNSQSWDEMSSFPERFVHILLFSSDLCLLSRINLLQ